MAEVRLEAVTKRFGEVVVIKELTLEIKNEEFMVLLGPSGCGKTITLRCIAGLEKPEKGDIYIEGVRVNAFSPADRDVALIFQNYSLYPWYTVRDNISFPLKAKRRNLSSKEIEKRVNEVAETLHIEHLMEYRPNGLSGGEMQRVAIGRAIVRRPRIFLMDEPLSNLDAKLREKMRVELKLLQSNLGATTLFVTHDQVEAMTMGDRIAVLNAGRIQQIGTPTEIYDHPRNLFVAKFVGSPGMNFITCICAKGILNVGPGMFSLNISPSQQKQIDEQNMGEELIFGVRPEDIYVYDNKPKFDAVKAEVYLVEPMGVENIVSLKMGENILRVITPVTFEAGIGDKVWVGLEKDRIHIFDKQTEKTII